MKGFRNYMDDFFIRMACLEDSEALTEIHCSALPDDLLPKLGKKYIKNVYYSKVLKSKYAITMLLEKGEIPVSFVTFTLEPEKLLIEIKKQKIALLLALIKNSFSQPGIVPSLWNNMNTKTHFDGNINPVDFPELFFIASVPDQQGKGLGKMLIKKGLQELEHISEKPGCIVKTSSESAFRFYIREGFKEIGYEMRGSRKFCILCFSFNRDFA
ncbi:MAG TPA: GNAT family N-acetyltransferase [Leptospiraceae bacterium]|nr:GNAT family N-acetyltransferase [Leptospiraceae bacterium]